MSGGAAAPLAARLSYAQCWEDWRVLEQALKVGPGDRVLSVASAGDNTIALALSGAEVVGLDLSLPQLALCELKLAGGALPYPRFLELLGLAPGDPVAAFGQIAGELTPSARAFWHERPELLRAGVLGGGRFERYLALFSNRILPLIHGRATRRALLEPRSPEAQRDFYMQRWDTHRWRALFRLFFSRAVMARLGRSPEQFAQVEGRVADRVLTRCAAVLGAQDMGDDPWVQWIVEGAWRDIERAHPWLTRAGHADLSAAAGRIRWEHAPLEAHLPACEPGRYTAFNLSNVGEYLPLPTWEALYAGLLHAGSPGARVAYWNLFVPRQAPAALAERVARDPERCAALLASDRVPFYGAFVLETLR